jgi:hypothetical protein
LSGLDTIGTNAVIKPVDPEGAQIKRNKEWVQE